ncbi:MAG: outer membrane protein assembly factor BamD [Spirochaetaceae bacterium]|nr:MAG: outer membrane protein assembly factor BamD [Spirochaetaceae bacterium]
MTRRSRVILWMCALLVLPVYTVAGADGRARFDEAIEYFSRSEFEAAATRLRQITESPSAQALHPEAFYWLGRTRLAQLDAAEATRYFDHLITTFPSHPRVTEARYHRARAAFIAGDVQRALVEFEAFIRGAPDSPFVANAWYWAGESLLALGLREEARALFDTVVREFPTSFRVEAARYRMSLIDLSEREEQLQRLLQWSHEEHLRTIESFRRAQAAWMDAVDAYRAAAEEADASDPGMVGALRTEIAGLLTRLARAEAEIAELRALGSHTPTAEGDLANRLRLAELKEATLRVKEQLLFDVEALGAGP